MILNETILAKPIIEEISRERLPDGVLCRVSYPISDIGKRNANGRIYEDAVWDKVEAEKDLQEKLANRALFGHAEHPEQTQSNLEKTSHVIIEMWRNGEQEWQKFDVLDTPTGRIVDCLLRAGCQVGCSTRAEGDLEEAEDDDGAYQRVIPESYKYVTTDFTADPSTFGSVPHNMQRNVVSEVERELKNEKLNGTEREFAQLIFESMKCQDSKCVVESAKEMAEKIEKEKEKKTIENLIKEGTIKVDTKVRYNDMDAKVTKVEEGKVSIEILEPTTDGKRVDIDGAARIAIEVDGRININPEPESTAPEPVEEPVEQAPLGEEPTITDPGNTGMGMPAVTGEELVDEFPEGKDVRGKRDGTGPYKGSAQRSVYGDKGVRKMRGEKCPVEKVVKEVPEAKKQPGAKVRHRGDVVFPAESSKVTDDKDHFPINNANQARNALARANQYSSAPKWYKGSLQSLVTKVANAVKKKYSSIEVSKAAEKPGKESIETGAVVKIEEGEYKDKEGEVTKIEEGAISISLDDGTVVSIEDPTAVQILVMAPLPEEEIEPVGPPEEEIEDTETAGSLSVEKDIPEEEVGEKKSVKEAGLSTEGGVSDQVASGNLLRDKEGKDWIVKEVGDGALIVTQPGEPGTEKHIEWTNVAEYGFTKVSESKVIEATSVQKNGEWFVESPSGAILGGPYKSKVEADKRKKDVEFYAASRESKVNESDEVNNLMILFDAWQNIYDISDSKEDDAFAKRRLKEISDELKQLGVENPDYSYEEMYESILKETADIKAMYKAAKLPAPDGKGIHTKAFHEFVINVAKGYVKGGDTAKEALKKAYPTAMKQLGKEKAVKKPHQKSESKTDETIKEEEGLESKQESKVNEGFSVGDDVEIMDLEGNTTVVPASEVTKVDDMLGNDGEFHTTIQTEKGGDEWYNEESYQLVKISITGESISTTAKEIKNLRVEEASTRAERDKAVELLEEITNDTQQLKEKVRKEKALEAKILVNKIGKTIEAKELEVDALRAKLEEKAKLAADLTEQVEEKNKLAVKVKKQLEEIKTNLSNDIKSLNESVLVAENKHQKDLLEAEKKYQKKLSKLTKLIEEKVKEAKEETKEEVTKEFVKCFVEFKLSETGLKIDENSRALLENCKSLEAVEDTLDEIMDASRRGALHSESISSIRVVKHEVHDPEVVEAEHRVNDCFEGMGFVKKG